MSRVCTWVTVCVCNVQVTHMPNLEDAIMHTVQGGSDNGASGEGEGSPESNGAGRPSSPPRRSTSPAERRKAAELEFEHSFDSASPAKTPHSAGLAGRAAQIFGNEAHQSSDIL